VIRQVGESRPLSPYTEALCEAGKTMFIESINMGRDFCKYMISVSTGAIPIYLGLFGFIFPEFFIVNLWHGVLIAAPAILFIIASIIFAVGYFPQSSRFSLEIVQEIEKAREGTIRKRQISAWLGFGIFLAGAVLAIISVFTHLLS